MPVKNDEQIEIYPICHNNIFYNIITNLDLELAEVREMLDWVQENSVMEHQMTEHPDMPYICEIDLKKARIIADAMNNEIFVYRREEK
jgi:hypothetical protein